MPRVKHYFEQNRFYHITSRTDGGVHTFASDEAKRIIVEALSFYRTHGDWRLAAFVIMANHIHLVAQQTKTDMSQVTGNFKKWVARQLGAAGQGALWERRFDDNAITHCVELTDVVQYIHNNPVRIGIVVRAEDYLWSSARNYSGEKPVAMEIDRLTESL